MNNAGRYEDDPLYDDAVRVVREQDRPSISNVQRHLKIGYNRAARLLEEMERKGVVSPMGSDGIRTMMAESPARVERVPASYIEGHRDGMERAALLVIEEAHSASSFLKEYTLQDKGYARLEAIVDNLTTLAKTIRAFKDAGPGVASNERETATWGHVCKYGGPGEIRKGRVCRFTSQEVPSEEAMK